MRLLKSLPGRDLEFTKDLDEDDLPPYAILSHTWGADEDEVGYRDVIDGTAEHKNGYRKLDFCAKQARRDGQSHFWVDTCCIDKTNRVELNTAITSMFRWYANATKCYVYLSDVSISPPRTDGDADASWQSQFRSCRWLTRGWTLQELLAPEVVEFYDRTFQKLGDRGTLERHIREVTRIPAAALRQCPLSSFSIQERFSWQRSRKTKKPEDEAYSLSGICEVSIVPMYGEGRDNAMARLRREVDYTLEGPKHRDFAVPFGDAGIAGVKNFVGRETELKEMHATLGGAGRRRAVVLHGPGGDGKTQLAIAYAWRHQDSYSAIFWLDMRDRISVKLSFSAIARHVLRLHPSAPYLSDVDLAGSLDGVVEAVKAWLSVSNNTRWLAIYDNYNDFQVSGDEDPFAVDIRDFLPDVDHGSAIVTTRSPRIGIGQAIPVGRFTSVQESIGILSSMSRRTLSADDPDVIALVRVIGGRPLGLATAGSYLDQVSVSIAEYLKLCASSWLRLHKSEDGLATYEDRKLYPIWNVSLDQVRRQNELSARLLGLWCYFSNQDIWFELIRDGPTEELPWLRDLTANSSVFTEAMQVLCNYGLADENTVTKDTSESEGYSVHPCVHSWTIHVLNKQWDDTLAAFAVRTTAKHVLMRARRGSSTSQRRLLQHAERCLLHLPEISTVQGTIKESLVRLGYLFSDQGQVKEAEEIYLRAVRWYERLGPKHTWTLETAGYLLAIFIELGFLYSGQGKMNEAEEMYLRALQLYEALGPEHSSNRDIVEFVGIVFEALGTLYTKQGKMKQAEAMYLRALRQTEEACGAKHTSTLDAVQNLGQFYTAQEKTKEAEEMCLRALRGKEEALGPKHTSTLNTVVWLGVLYFNNGKVKKAEEMFLRGTQGREEALGPKHISTVESLSLLSRLYWGVDNRPEARRMSLRVLEGYESAQGAHEADIQYHKTRLSTGKGRARERILGALAKWNDSHLGD